MSYCRFRNTVSDLRDCYDNGMDEMELSFEERLARWHLIRLCQKIADDYGYEGGQEYRPKRAEAVPEQDKAE